MGWISKHIVIEKYEEEKSTSFPEPDESQGRKVITAFHGNHVVRAAMRIVMMEEFCNVLAHHSGNEPSYEYSEAQYARDAALVEAYRQTWNPKNLDHYRFTRYLVSSEFAARALV